MNNTAVSLAEFLERLEAIGTAQTYRELFYLFPTLTDRPRPESPPWNWRLN